MAPNAAKVRLHVEAPLDLRAEVALGRDQSKYLLGVMRLGPGDGALLFNGRDGEWLARIEGAGKREARLVCEARTREQTEPPDLELLFAPIKKARTDFIVEKAAELGCRRVRPVFTRFTNAERVNAERLRAHAVEAAEQCGLLSVPAVEAPERLDDLLAAWEVSRKLLFCDEAGDAPPAVEAMRAAGPGKWAVLIGPEGGFAPEERSDLRAASFTVPASLGPRVLRADTAAAAALALWQATLGDWA